MITNQQCEYETENGSCFVFYWDDGGINREIYKNKKREIHREGDFPAIIDYYANGKILAAQYLIGGKYHRIGKPARITFFKDGLVDSKAYWHKGRRSRFDGPAIIKYMYENGAREDHLIWMVDDQVTFEITEAGSFSTGVPVVVDNRFLGAIPTNEKILDVILNFHRGYGMFLKKFKEENYVTKT